MGADVGAVPVKGIGDAAPHTSVGRSMGESLRKIAISNVKERLADRDDPGRVAANASERAQASAAAGVT